MKVKGCSSCINSARRKGKCSGRAYPAGKCSGACCFIHNKIRYAGSGIIFSCYGLITGSVQGNSCVLSANRNNPVSYYIYIPRACNDPAPINRELSPFTPARVRVPCIVTVVPELIVVPLKLSADSIILGKFQLPVNVP